MKVRTYENFQKGNVSSQKCISCKAQPHIKMFSYRKKVAHRNMHLFFRMGTLMFTLCFPTMAPRSKKKKAPKPTFGLSGVKVGSWALLEDTEAHFDTAVSPHTTRKTRDARRNCKQKRQKPASALRGRPTSRDTISPSERGWCSHRFVVHRGTPTVSAIFLMHAPKPEQYDFGEEREFYAWRDLFLAL